MAVPGPSRTTEEIVEIDAFFTRVFELRAPEYCQAVYLEKEEGHETLCDIAVTYESPYWLKILKEYRPGWKVIQSSLFKFTSDRITVTLKQCCHDDRQAVIMGPSELLSCQVQYDWHSITSPELLKEAVKMSSYPPSITCVVTYNEELRSTGKPTWVGLPIRGMDPEMEFQCKAYERKQAAPHTLDSAQTETTSQPSTLKTAHSTTSEPLETLQLLRSKPLVTLDSTTSEPLDHAYGVLQSLQPLPFMHNLAKSLWRWPQTLSKPVKSVEIDAFFTRVFELRARECYQAVYLEKEEGHETVCNIAVMYASPYWLKILKEYRPGWEKIKPSSFKFTSDRITVTLKQCCHDDRQAVIMGPSELLSCQVQYDWHSITSPELLKEAVKMSSYPPSITCVVTYNEELRSTGKPTWVRLPIRGMDPEMEFQCKAYERKQVSPPPHTPGSAQVSFAILTANKREELAVNGFLGLDCVNHTNYPHASKLQYSSDAVLKDAKAKVEPLPDDRYTHRLFSLEVNGSKQVGVHVYCDKMGPWGAFHKTVELLKTAKDEEWKLRYIFIVGCCGASVIEAKKKDFPRGTVLLAEQVKDYLNTGKVEEECEEDIAEEMVKGRAPTFKIKGSPTTYSMDSALLTQMIREQSIKSWGAFNVIEVKKVDYLSGPLVIKSSLFGATFRDPSVDACGVEMEAVGVLKAVETFQTISGGPKAEVVLAKGISDYTGRKGESGSCKFFDETIKDATDDQLQMNATVQSIALVIRFVAKNMKWLFNQRPLKY